MAKKEKGEAYLNTLQSDIARKKEAKAAMAAQKRADAEARDMKMAMERQAEEAEKQAKAAKRDKLNEMNQQQMAEFREKRRA